MSELLHSCGCSHVEVSSTIPRMATFSLGAAALTLTEQAGAEEVWASLAHALVALHQASGCDLSASMPRFSLGPARPEHGVYLVSTGSMGRRLRLIEPQCLSPEAAEQGAVLAKIAERWLDAITQVQHLHQSLERLSAIDSLTGVAHRRGFVQAVTERLQTAQGKPRLMALVIVDIRGFRRINERFGHEVGDELLFEVAGKVRTQLREHDLMARLERDQFALLLDQIPNLESVERVAQRLIASLESPPIPLDEWQGARLGIALFPEDAQSAQSLIDAAAVALMTARSSGQAMAYCQ